MMAAIATEPARKYPYIEPVREPSFILISMPKNHSTLISLFVLLLAPCLLVIIPQPFLYAQAGPMPNPKSIPFIDGGIGSCTADFTITTSAGAPIYDAQIKVHISYGMFGAHKLDLQVGTNADGKARFTGLPEKTKQGLFFQASKGNLTGSAFDDPSKTCNAQFTLALQQQNSQLFVPSSSSFAALQVASSQPHGVTPANLIWNPRPASPIMIISTRNSS